MESPKNTMYFFPILKENVEFDKMKLGDRVGVGAVTSGCVFVRISVDTAGKNAFKLKKKLTKSPNLKVIR